MRESLETHLLYLSSGINSLLFIAISSVVRRRYDFVKKLHLHGKFSKYNIKHIPSGIVYKINDQLISNVARTNRYTVFVGQAETTTETVTGAEILKQIGANNSELEIHPETYYTVQRLLNNKNIYLFKERETVTHIGNNKSELIGSVDDKKYNFIDDSLQYTTGFIAMFGIIMFILDHSK